MGSKSYMITMIALIVALGGLLMGFDASVISGVIKFIEVDFSLTSMEIGFSVSSLALVAMFAMLAAGPVSDQVGRRTVLRWAAILYAISAIGSALAPNYWTFIVARMIGGLGVGASLILAPMYIAEMAPPNLRGRLVSFNQLNIVIGLSLAFFTNYLILRFSKTDAGWVQALGIDRYTWRWMLGLEAVPAVLYFLGLFFVPRSPRWLALKGRIVEAEKVRMKISPDPDAMEPLDADMGDEKDAGSDMSFVDRLGQFFSKKMRLVIIIGLAVAILQQITGINAVFFYAPMIFEQAGFGEDASFMQAIFVGLINLVFTVLAILFIDRLGRKPLLIFGLLGIAVFMSVLSYAFNTATYTLTNETIENVSENLDPAGFQPMMGTTYNSDLEFSEALETTMSEEEFKAHGKDLLNKSISINSMLVLIAILGFVAAFAISLGPVMWVLFSELFPNAVRGIAISVVGFANSLVSWGVQQFFPVELEAFGSSTTFLIYGVFAAVGLVFAIFVIPETKGKSLEELEAQLVK